MVDKLVADLLAAIEETERIAREATGESVLLEADPSWTAVAYRGAIVGGRTHAVNGEYGTMVAADLRKPKAEHIARHDPDATLRLCAAHKRIVERAARLRARCDLEPDNLPYQVAWATAKADLTDLAKGYGLEVEEP